VVPFDLPPRALLAVVDETRVEQKRQEAHRPEDEARPGPRPERLGPWAGSRGGAPPAPPGGAGERGARGRLIARGHSAPARRPKGEPAAQDDVPPPPPAGSGPPRLRAAAMSTRPAAITSRSANLYDGVGGARGSRWCRPSSASASSTGRHVPAGRAIRAASSALPFCWHLHLGRGYLREQPISISRPSPCCREAPHAVVQVALLLVMAAGLVLIAAALSLGGPLPARRRGGYVVLGGWLAFGLLAGRCGPERSAYPSSRARPAPPGGAGGAPPRLPAHGPSRSGRGWAGLVLGTVGLLSLLLYPSLVHYGEKGARRQIERDHAPLILRQPQWRAFRPERGAAQGGHPGPARRPVQRTEPARPGGVAFATWTATDLASLGFSSAVEIQDASGLVISRFALNLPTLDIAGQRVPCPPTLPGKSRGSAQPCQRGKGGAARPPPARVLRGEPGAVHLYPGRRRLEPALHPGARPLFPALPLFLGERRPHRPVELLVYDPGRRIAFSSADRPPALAPRWPTAYAEARRGQWATMLLDGRLHHTFLSRMASRPSASPIPGWTPAAYLAGLVEAFAGFCSSPYRPAGRRARRTALGRQSLTLRSLFAGVRRRFTLRLFVAFVAAAIIPVAVLEVVVRRFVRAACCGSPKTSPRTGLPSPARRWRTSPSTSGEKRRACSRDGPSPRLGFEPPPERFSTCSARPLLASSMRELYASACCWARVAGSGLPVAQLDQAPSALRTERIGSFSTLVVSVPVKLAPGEAGILVHPPRPAAARAAGDARRPGSEHPAGFGGVPALRGRPRALMSRRISGPIRTSSWPPAGCRRRPRGPGVSNARASCASCGVRSTHGGRPGAPAPGPRAEQPAGGLGRVARQVAHEVKKPPDSDPALRGAPASRLRRSHRGFPCNPGRLTDTILKQVGTLRRLVTEFSALRPAPGPGPPCRGPGPIVRAAVEPYLPGLPRAVRLGLEIERTFPGLRRPAPVERAS